MQPGDTSMFATEATVLGLLGQKESAGVASCEPVTEARNLGSLGQKESAGVASCKAVQSQFRWLGDPCGIKYTGKGDIHRCSECGLKVSDFVEGDTFLNQHAYFTGGDCPYLKLNYTSERLHIEIGQERYRRGFVAHPGAISVPGPWNDPPPKLTQGIYLTLCNRVWCYMCGKSPTEHNPNCHQSMAILRTMITVEMSRRSCVPLKF